MKNLKKTSILLASLAVVFGAGSASNNSANNVRKIRKAAGDTHNLIFKGDARGVGNYALSHAGWWNVDSCTFANSTVTIPNGSTSYFSNGSIKANETYVISYDLKTNGDAYFQFNLNTPTHEWKNFQKGTFNNSDYVHYDFIHTATADHNDMTFYFQVTGGVEIYVQNLYVYSTTSISVTEGQAIGTLPEVASIEGKKGYWTIDDTKITNESIYNYSVDKVVHAKYEDVCSITYHNGGAIDLASDTKYWKSGTNLVKEDGVLHMKNEDGLADKPIHNYDASDPLIATVEVGKKYKLSFDIKCDNVYLRVANCSPWTMIVDGWKNYSDFTRVESEFTVDSNGVAKIRFRVDTTGNVYIKNLHLYEVTAIEYSKNQVLGELPSINGLGNYDSATWQIDGKDITNESIFNFDTPNKKAYAKYDFYDSTKFINEWKQLRALGGENGICAILVKDSEAQTTFNNLMEKYESLSDNDKNIVNNTLDVGEVTIGTTINYIKNVLDGSIKTEGEYDINSGVVITSYNNYDKSSLIALFTILGILTISGYYIIEKKKYSK